MDRRRFIELLGAAAALPLVNGCGSPDEADAARRLRERPIGLQLYTVRGEIERDLEGILARVAEIGYREVEFAGYFGHSPRQVRVALDAAGLVAPSAHVDLSLLRDRWPQTLEAAHTIGHQYLVCAWIPQEERTLQGYHKLAALFDAAGETASRAAIRFAYHNHDFEFEPLDGLVPYDILLEKTSPQNMALELDLYWITKAGADPLAYFGRWPGRFPLVHVKDMDAAGRITDVGSGVIDFANIFGQASTAGIRHYFVEHDQPEDAFASVRQSYEAMTRLLHAGARGQAGA